MSNLSSKYRAARRLSPPADAKKPYARIGLRAVLGNIDVNSGDLSVPTTPDSPYYPFHVETPQLEAPSQHRASTSDAPRDIPGFPTYEQYKYLEEEYLASLSDRKQPKALISQDLFDKIYAVLQSGSEDRASTAQFRFWVRKMFVFTYPQTSFSQNNSGNPEPLVLHDKRPVAIREQLYEVLCYCHALARHGGRDKTCATLRLHYSWVPKELTAKFVKSCPTCTLKRSGNPDLLSHFNHAVAPPYPSPLSPTGTIPGGPNDPPAALSLSMLGVPSADVAAFAPSMFATPELGMYPSPTLSTGSGGPATPSPYLASGLFGYPAMFDPGHLAAGGLPNVTGWDPSRTPCMQVSVIPADAEDEPEQQGATQAADAIIDARARSLQLRLPTPKKARLARGAADDRLRGIGLDLGLGLGSLDAPGADGNGHIDPALLMAGPAYSMDVDLDEDPDADADADEGGLDAHFLLRLAAWDTPPPAPPPSPGLGPLPVGKTKAMLFGDEAQRAVDADARCRATRWESLDAWLVPSSSAGSDGLGPV